MLYNLVYSHGCIWHIFLIHYLCLLQIRPLRYAGDHGDGNFAVQHERLLIHGFFPIKKPKTRGQNDECFVNLRQKVYNAIFP